MVRVQSYPQALDSSDGSFDGLFDGSSEGLLDEKDGLGNGSSLFDSRQLGMEAKFCGRI